MLTEQQAWKHFTAETGLEPGAARARGWEFDCNGSESRDRWYVAFVRRVAGEGAVVARLNLYRKP